MIPSWADPEIRMDIEALAAHFERIHGVRPDRLSLGAAVARQLEPDADRVGYVGGPVHPPHLLWVSRVPGIWEVAWPATGDTRLERFRRRRNCRRLKGGHFWHPGDPMILWFCCWCGADRDGMPADGS